VSIVETETVYANLTPKLSCPVSFLFKFMNDIILREYQKQAIDKVLWSMKLEGNDLISLPTGAGKSIVVAELAKRIDKEVLILQPSKEILEQNMAKLLLYVDPSEVGVFSASMGRKDISKFTFATIGSIYTKPELFKHIGLVIIDECHLVNPKNTGGMFTTFLKAIGNPKVIGLTATIYRNVLAYHLISGTWQRGEMECKTTLKLICRMKPFFWNRLMFNIDLGDLTRQGFLSPLRYEHRAFIKQEDMKFNKSESDFDLVDFEKKLGSRQEQIAEAVLEAQQQYKSVLVFCSSVGQAEKLASVVKGAEVVSAKTKPKERERIIEGFKSGEIKTVFNMGVLTTGFDHPSLDCIILVRPTRSVGLYYQMLGRGVRIAEGKKFCAVIDYTDTVRKLGELESIRLVKDEEKKWNLQTSTGLWHGRQLYSWNIKTAPKQNVLFGGQR
jgi:DNA repair protein RadD